MRFGFGGSERLEVINRFHGAQVWIMAEDAAGAERALFTGDPDSLTAMYYAGTSHFITTSAGAEVNRNGAVTSTLQIGENLTLYGDAASGLLRIHGEQTGVIYDLDIAVGSARATLGGTIDAVEVNTDWDIRAGNSLIIRNAGNIDTATFSHDGTDFNTAFANTADWNLTSLTSLNLNDAFLHFSDVTGKKLDFFSGYEIGIESSTLWYRSNLFHRFYSNNAPDGGVSSVLTIRGDGPLAYEFTPKDMDTTAAQVAIDLSYTVNKITSGDDTGLRIDKTDTASAGTSRLIDAQVGGVTQFWVGDNGQTALRNYVFNTDQTVGAGQDQYALVYNDGTGEIELTDLGWHND
jgi:hypothetical protein